MSIESQIDRAMSADLNRYLDDQEWWLSEKDQEEIAKEAKAEYLQLAIDDGGAIAQVTEEGTWAWKTERVGKQQKLHWEATEAFHRLYKRYMEGQHLEADEKAIAEWLAYEINEKADEAAEIAVADAESRLRNA